MANTPFGAVHGTDAAQAKPACVALVPLAPSPRRPPATGEPMSRPDPSFVAHLIAMAELSPQTRVLRRAGPEHAQAAYRSVANQNRPTIPPGIRMRRTA
jgi:hypothetical protein